MTKVFISYSRRDLAFVEQLVSDLKGAGLDVWYDLSGLDGGTRWRIEIENAIRASQHVIVVLSPDSVGSEWVEREYLFASNLKKNKKCVGCKMCVLACPFGSVVLFPEKGKAEKCDHCLSTDGDPECVTFCTPEALEYLDEDSEVRMRQMATAAKLRETFAETH